MSYLLDTCVLSELVKPLPNGGLLDWLNATPNDRLFLPSLTIGEIRKGIVKMPNSQRKTHLTQWLEQLISDYQNRIISVDLAVAQTWGNLQGNAEANGRPLASIDGLIAAIAVTHHLTVVTRNEKDFTATSVRLLNPWA